MAYISKFKCSEIDSILTESKSTKSSFESYKKNTNDIIAELEESLGGKQEKISDLENIRQGAALGATAIQQVKTINGESIEGNGNIVIRGGGSENIGVTVNLNGDEVCAYYAINKNGEHVATTAYSCTSYIDCYGCGTMDITLIQSKSSIGYGLAFYDENKTFISYVDSKVGSEKKGVVTTVTIPDNAHYFRTTYFTYAEQKKYGDFSCTLTYSTDVVSNEGKRKYQDGYIFFSQRVNQSVTKYWSTDETVANDANMNVTTGVLALPTTYKNTGRKTPLILYAHGLSHYVYYGAWGNTDTFREQKQHWLDMGFAVMDCNGARDKKGGQFPTGICPQGVNAYKQCVDYVTKHYNVDQQIFIVAGSAGGALGWNYLSMYGSTVKAAVFISAWADLEYNAWTNGGAKSLFTEFLGFDNTSTYEVDKTIGFDQKYRIITIGSKDYCFMPYNVPIYGLYGGTETTLVDPMKKTFAALRNAGANAQIRGIAGCGHEIVSGANIVVDTEIGNWFLSHWGEMSGEVVVREKYTITYKYLDKSGAAIKNSSTEEVYSGTVKDFSSAPAISGYEFIAANPNNATVTSHITVVYTYKKVEEPDVPVEPDEPEIEGNDLSSLFTFDRKGWMCVSNPQFKSSSYFDSCYTDLSAYIGKTIRITVPQYTSSNGQASTGVTFWTATPTEQPSAYNRNNLIKLWDTHNAGNAKGILVEVETVVPADAPYIWTSTYNDNAVSLGVYVGENDGYTDFKCYVVEESGDEPEIKYHTVTYQYKDVDGNVIKVENTYQIVEDTELDFVNNAPTINGYDFVSVVPTNATITSDITVVFTYQKKESEVVGDDLSGLFTWDRDSWMAVKGSPCTFKSSTAFMSCMTDMSAYIGKTIRLTVPQYTSSAGSSSTGYTMWMKSNNEHPGQMYELIKMWDVHTDEKSKGILVEVETVVPAEAPYLWTSIYRDGVAAYVGGSANSRDDFKCYIVE